MKKSVLMMGVGVLWAGMASANTWYVATNSASDGPGTAWSTAFHTIQGGVDAAVSNDTVLVSNGVYDVGVRVTPENVSSNRVVITNNIVVRSVSGPKGTFIVGAEATGGGNGTNAVRGVYMSAGTLDGFTVSDGHTRAAGSGSDYDYDRSGGGINLYGGNGMVTNCVLTGNSAGEEGGGSYSGLLYDCTLTGNSALWGGGSAEGTLNDCTFSDNSAVNYGGGSYQCTLSNCMLMGNLALWGAGSSECTLQCCILSGNLATNNNGTGGGCYGSTLSNCLISGNKAIRGGGSRDSSLTQCTIAGNTADYGGGTYRGEATNCIVSRNTAAYGYDNYYQGTFVYSCCDPLPGGSGNINNLPQFTDPAAGDYHLAATSPCIDSGNNTYAVGGEDLDGVPRPLDGDADGINTVDMGCYEFVSSTGDSDSDGLSDSNELYVTGTSLLNANTDGDPMDDYKEYIADTDGTDSNDYFRITDFGNEPPTLYFDSSSNRQYTLLWSTNLLAGVWIPVESRMGIGGADSMQATNDLPVEFLKLKVEVP